MVKLTVVSTFMRHMRVSEVAIAIAKPEREHVTFGLVFKVAAELLQHPHNKQIFNGLNPSLL